jgi:hypothetical protein
VYIANHAQSLSFSRKKNRKAYKFTENIAKEAKNLLGGTPLEKFYSPKQIVGAMKKENLLTNLCFLLLQRFS